MPGDQDLMPSHVLRAWLGYQVVTKAILDTSSDSGDRGDY